MENASKALLMAAGVLMAIVILSFAAFLYASFGGSTERIQNTIEQGQLEQFNNQFIQYTAKECTMYDIVSVVNLANDYNTKNGFKDSDVKYYIKVWVNGNVVNSLTIEDLKILLMDKSYSKIYGEITTSSDGTPNYQLIKFSCNVNYSDMTGKVNNVTFSTKK